MIYLLIIYIVSLCVCLLDIYTYYQNSSFKTKGSILDYVIAFCPLINTFALVLIIIQKLTNYGE